MSIQSVYPDQTPPALVYKILWSSTNFYTFNPTASSWSGGVLTTTYVNHNLTTGDVVSFVSTSGSSLWNINDVVATVIDKDTFTVPLAGDPGTYPAPSAKYPVELVSVFCKEYSMTAFKPTVIQCEALPTGTSIEVQGKLHPDSDWSVIATISPTDGASQVNFDPRINFIRCAISAGTGQPVVYSQD